MESDSTYVIDMFERSDMEALKKKGGVEGMAQWYETDLKTGLSQSEKDSEFEERKKKYGTNVLPDPPQETWFKLFIDSFEDLMLKILLVSALLSAILTTAFPESGKIEFSNYIDSISIFVTVLLVAIVQAQTNYAQQKSFQEINKLKNIFSVTVIRYGEEMQILNTELLVGDILALKNGDRVAADALYISGHNLKINNSQETGESVAVNINEERPFILGGGAVESGDAHALVCAVGPLSQSGVTMMKIQELSEKAEQSPLEKKLDIVAIKLTYIGLGGALLTFLVLLGFWIADVSDQKWDNSQLNVVIKHFMTAVTIFICAVPEGLPLAVTLSLSFSMKKMMKDNNFVRHLNACETMGGATTICSDKTGTLTQNKMTVVRFYQVGKVQQQDPEMTPLIKDLFITGVAVNTSAYMTYKDDVPMYVGPSSECALLQMLPKYEADYKSIRESLPIEVLHEFNSERKRMSTIVKDEKGYTIHSKGAPDFLLKSCTHYLTPEGEKLELTEEIKAQMLEQVGLFADDSLRTLLLAYKKMDEEEPKEEWKVAENVEKDLTAICIVGIADPLRPEVVKAIQDCKKASVVVRMVTGDYINTAKAISRECGILDESAGHIAIDGAEFAKKSKLELVDLLPNLRVMARSSPRDKYRLVSVLMELGEIVAVTGDGSNDSAALKKANVGLSMGQCGTELAKIASDIVILDDNFNSIVNALKWGRCIYDNVRGFLQFQLTVNFAAMFVAFIGSVYLHYSPLKTIQLLWVNMIMDSLGAIALATRGPSDALLNRAPYGEGDGLISNVMGRNILGHTIYQLIVLLLYIFGSKPLFGVDRVLESKRYGTMIFNMFVLFQLFNLINARIAGQDMSIFDGLFNNPYFIAIFFIIGGLQVLIVEVITGPFECEPLRGTDWAICIGFGLGSLVVGALLRLITLPDHTTAKLNALRAVKTEEFKARYAGMTPEEQWNYNENVSEEKIVIDA